MDSFSDDEECFQNESFRVPIFNIYAAYSAVVLNCSRHVSFNCLKRLEYIQGLYMMSTTAQWLVQSTPTDNCKIHVVIK